MHGRKARERHGRTESVGESNGLRPVHAYFIIFPVDESLGKDKCCNFAL